MLFPSAQPFDYTYRINDPFRGMTIFSALATLSTFHSPHWSLCHLNWDFWAPSSKQKHLPATNIFCTGSILKSLYGNEPIKIPTAFHHVRKSVCLPYYLQPCYSSRISHPSHVQSGSRIYKHDALVVLTTQPVNKCRMTGWSLCWSLLQLILSVCLSYLPYFPTSSTLRHTFFFFICYSPRQPSCFVVISVIVCTIYIIGQISRQLPFRLAINLLAPEIRHSLHLLASITRHLPRHSSTLQTTPQLRRSHFLDKWLLATTAHTRFQCRLMTHPAQSQNESPETVRIIPFQEGPPPAWEV